MYKYLNCGNDAHSLHPKAIESLEKARKEKTHEASNSHIHNLHLDVKEAAEKKQPHDHGHVGPDGSHASHSLA